MAGKVACQIRQTDRVQIGILIGLGELYWYKISLYCYCQYNASKQFIEDQVSFASKAVASYNKCIYQSLIGKK